MYKQYIEEINSIRDLEIVISYYFPNQLKRNKMNCPFHKEKTPSFSIADKGNGAFYKCFGCGEGGGIINFIQKVESISFIEALKKAYEILNRPLDLPKNNIKPNGKINKNRAVEFYNEEVTKAIADDDIDEAFELSCKADEEANQNYFIKFPYVDEKNRPKKIWENLRELLKANNVGVYYNEITKDIEIEGVDGRDLESKIMDIHSTSLKYGLNLNIQMIDKFVNRIGRDCPHNPVVDYLRECYLDFDGNKENINKLCKAIITPQDYSTSLKEILITKWLLNTATIPFNDGETNIEGILTLQGKQGIGKTRFIKKLVPMYVKTGLELDPTDKDKIYQCIKYWVAELGELDSTLKRDLAKLKAFITEPIDEFRRPYGIKPMIYPRKTSFYATVNNDDFLKDDTGNRRYWVVPVEKIDFEIIDSIDINQLWGEVMHIKEEAKIKSYLEIEEMNMLNVSNEDFKVVGSVEIAVNREFDWSVDKSNWSWKASMDIASKLNVGTTKGIKSSLINRGAIYKKVSDKRGYITPPYKSFFSM